MGEPYQELLLWKEKLMNYNQTCALFEAMDDLETYARLCQSETSKDSPDWDTYTRYTDYKNKCRKQIFDMVSGADA